MDEEQSQSDRKHGVRRQPLSRPPIQWPVQKHVMTDDRRKAAELARAAVRRAQTTGAIHQKSEKITEPLEQESAPNEKAESINQQDNVEPQNEAQVAETLHQTMREEPFDWRLYHSAWQQYYHRYFYQYYANWWLQQKPYLQAQQTAQKNEETEEELKKRIAAEARSKIRTTVSSRAKKVKNSNHFKPTIAALLAGASFLLFNYNQILVGALKQYVTPGSVVTTPVIVEPNIDGKVSKAPQLIIPKIGVDVPVVYDEPKVDEASYQKALERGVVRLGNTANPGTNGNVVIGGHSSNNVFNAGGYKYVFVNLRRLDVGDVFYLNYNGQRYTYKVFVAKKIISPTDVSALASTGKPIVTLFTCDPPGTNINRLIVQAAQVDPDPLEAKTTTNQVKVNQSNPLPSVAPSIWDRLFGN
jgi:sortase A